MVRRQANDGIDIPLSKRNYRYIKTIALSVFNTRERTSWHFGPLRLTFRVLYNLDPINGRDVYIEVDDTSGELPKAGRLGRRL